MCVCMHVCFSLDSELHPQHGDDQRQDGGGDRRGELTIWFVGMSCLTVYGHVSVPAVTFVSFS